MWIVEWIDANGSLRAVNCSVTQNLVIWNLFVSGSGSKKYFQCKTNTFNAFTHTQLTQTWILYMYIQKYCKLMLSGCSLSANAYGYTAHILKCTWSFHVLIQGTESFSSKRWSWRKRKKNKIFFYTNKWNIRKWHQQPHVTTAQCLLSVNEVILSHCALHTTTIINGSFPQNSPNTTQVCAFVYVKMRPKSLPLKWIVNTGERKYFNDSIFTDFCFCSRR